MAAEHVSSPRRSSRLPGSRSRSLYRNPGTPIGKPINYLDFATIKLPAPAYERLKNVGEERRSTLEDCVRKNIGQKKQNCKNCEGKGTLKKGDKIVRCRRCGGTGIKP